jgi:hypothetical protein
VIGFKKWPGRGGGSMKVAKIRQINGYQKTFKIPSNNMELNRTLGASDDDEVSIYWNYWLLDWSPIPVFHNVETALEIHINGEPFLTYNYASHLKINGAERLFRILAIIGLILFSYLNIRPWTITETRLNQGIDKLTS